MIILSNTKSLSFFPKELEFQTRLSFWRFGKRPIPIDKMVLIEKETNNLVTRKDLCKNWHEIWPELNTDNR